jgi:UDP-N-acetylglucosamine 2-epimerase
MALSGDGWLSFAKVAVRMAGEETDRPEGVANYHLLLAAPTMAEALEEAAKTFRRYEQMYADKNTVEGQQKTAANAFMAKKMEAALRLAKGEDRNG